jgi:hypothetical protein
MIAFSQRAAFDSYVNAFRLGLRQELRRAERRREEQ